MKRHFTHSVAAVLVVLILWAATEVAHGQDSSSVVRVNIGETWGSGAYLGDRLVLSCAHLFAEAGDNRQVNVSFDRGEQHSGVARAIDWQWDQSLIELDTAPTTPGVCLASANPVRGEPVTAMGYAFGRELLTITGRVGKYVSATGETAADWFEFTGESQDGCSGGPVFDQTGALIGNLWGRRAGITVAVMCGRTQLFLFPWRARLAAARQTQCANGTCPPGQRCQPPRTRLAPLQPPRPRIIVEQPRQSPATTVAPPAVPPNLPPSTDVPQVPPPPIEPQIDYDHLADLVIERMKRDPDVFRGGIGPAGAKGDKGEKGDTGLSGKDGTSAAIDTIALAQAIQAALPGITVRTIDATGQVLDSEHIPLGGTLNIIHKPLTTR